MALASKTAPRLAWSLWGLTLALSALALVYQLRSLEVHALDVYGYRGLALVIGLSYATVGAVIASRRPAHPHGWLFSAVGLLVTVHGLSQEYASFALERGPGMLARIAAWNNEWLWVPWVFSVGTFALLFFPDGRLPSRRWRPAVVLAAVGMVVTSASLALAPGPLEAFSAYRNPFGVAGAAEALDAVEGIGLMVLMASLAVSVASVVVRMRRASPEERLQLRWFRLAGLLLLLALGLNALESFLPAKLPALAVMTAMTMLPVALGIGILRYRALDIDVVVRKTVVYALLAAAATALYLFVVVALPALVLHPTTTTQTVITVAATAGLTLALLPLRRRATHLANRLVYGRRATPYEVLSEFSERVGGAYSNEDVLPRMARLIVESTGASRGEVWMRLGPAWRLGAVWPPDADPGSAPAEDAGTDRALRFEVRHGGELLGALAIAKPPSDPITEAEEHLLENLASQAGLVLRNVRLTEELRANLDALRESRQRLVTGQDVERRRLERDIHDGAQQHLVALAVKLRLLEGLIRKDPDRAVSTAAELKGQANDALETLRELARGIYPPLLADQGLAAALDAQARRAPVAVTVSPDGVGRYAPEIEAAVYFCALEALQNVAKYAEASRADLTLRQTGETLEFEVRDDGRGFDPASTPRGSGLQNMADRLEALGGSLEVASAPGEGTIVTGRLPAAGR